jgi:hypothetical protein
MLRISQESNRTGLSLDGGSFRKAARVSCVVASRLPLGSTHIAKKPGRIGAVALLPLLFIAFVAFAGIASAQNPPDGILAAPLGPSAVKVTVTACLYSTEDSCNAPLVIYRNPPGFTQSPVHTASLGEGTYGANNTEAIWMDTTVKGGTSYTYRVCTGAAKLDPGHQNVAIPSGSTSVGPGTYTITATNGVGQASASVSINVTCPTPWAPPTNISALVGSNINLTWTNPNTSPDQWCPGPSSKVLIYRMGTNGYQQLAELDKAANSGTLPNRYSDNGPFQPHTGYIYELCEGAPPTESGNNCASPPGATHDSAGYGFVTGGANPTLSATRVNPNTVKLKLSLDQFTMTSVSVTRQGSDDPCRQGGTLGNGLQGCPTTNGLGGSPAQTTTVYNWTWSSGSQYPPGWQNTQTAPFVINLPDDTAVKPGVEYYYIAHVVWEWSVAQDSQTVTAPKNAYASATLQQTLAGGSIPIKQNGGAPPPQS